ncbi:MAG: hypothetical protein WCJ64_07475 [Rhodospirillaceae bacterium]
MASRKIITIVEEAPSASIFQFLSGFTHIKVKELTPPPPSKDVLGFPIFMHGPPRVILRQRKLPARLLEVVTNLVLTPDQRAQKDAHVLIATLLACIWPETTKELKEKGWITTFSQVTRERFRVKHPFNLDFALAALLAMPKHLQSERRALEVIIAMVLTEYKKRISTDHEKDFSFEAHARRHALLGYRIERLLRHVTARAEQEHVIQQLYNSYLYAARYYEYSLISRESLINDGVLFKMYCRASLFNAHIESNGRVLDRVSRTQMPQRESVMFFVLRDSALRKRYNEDPEYAEVVKSLVRVFPTQARS